MPRDNPTWSPRDYLKFERERTLPCRDLVDRIDLEFPSTIVDLGCGPGNSTAVLLERWPSSRVVGLDSSAQMLEIARASGLRADWVLSDIREWRPLRKFDLVFSNAALQWVPDHRVEIPRIFGLVAPGGALAIQMPSGGGRWAEALRRVTESPRWDSRFPDRAVSLGTEELPFYYDLLSASSARIDLWQTEYFHVLSSPADVVDWTTGTALRPLIQLLGEEERARFVSDYTKEIERAYPPRPDGRVLFPFLRRFWVAYL